MDWIVGILLLVVGTIIGFFIAKQTTKKPSVATEKDAQKESHKKLFVQQTSVYLESAFSSIAEIEKQCEASRSQLEHFQSQLKTFSRDESKPQEQFFGEQASVYLRNSESKKTSTVKSSDVQPRDYSGEASGLLQTKTEASSD